ncbi:late embryogenesis abundant protein, LEA-14 [Artemisia annua]|uniref:Late embryogenesis abundant protein, LEA-14 n=1 Tax=Artemisia annua TaxID=35608 RepID=A0A2U1NME5_ARTAN|nr:late embryogenesis abundant protein, LEA-14 [Artemisia annua]
MSMHAKTDSEVTSLTASSPQRSPRRPVYYVQSPSRESDSHDGEKTTNSFHSTPVLSPSGSPGRQSRNSSSTRYSGSLRPGSRKGSQHQHHRKGEKGFDAIEEEGLYDEDGRKPIPRRCYFLAFVVGFFVLFTFFALVLWGAARPQKPVITMRSIAFDQFVVNAGADASGVATEMVTLNATIKFNFRNRGTFFGVHVSSTTVDLAYTELTLASGSIKKFYQKRKGHRLVSVNVRGVGVPLYGGGVNWSSERGKLTAPVPLNLNFTVKAKAYVLGKLVKPRFNKKVSCAIVYKPTKVINTPISLKNSCTVQ